MMLAVSLERADVGFSIGAVIALPGVLVHGARESDARGPPSHGEPE